MKLQIIRISTLLIAFALFSGFIPRPEVGTAVVKIDGKVISPSSVLSFDRDDTVYLEATGIKPQSTIQFKVRKLGVRWYEDQYEVDETGEVRGVLQIPEEKLTVNCTVSYFSADNAFHEVTFKFRTV